MTRLSLILSVVLSGAASAGEPMDYLQQVKPLLAGRCYACHGALKQESNLRLDTAELARQGGDSGPALIPGNSSDSLLIRHVLGADGLTLMPVEGTRLSDEEVARLRTWIDSGAAGPADEQPQADPRQHWAFLPPARPPVPAAATSAWVRNPVDAFLAVEHQRRGLTPVPEAERHVLLRRVYLDLLGLPPSRGELRSFLADDSPDAYERLVDRLLDDPSYGERWGRHWMDVWRYSDWYGRRAVPDVMNSYPQIWRWRDWIVRSLNEGQGYDRMLVEMLAADEVSPGDDQAVVATGFVVRNWYKWNYNSWMKDAVEHTGKAFLGLTLNCCHCHDHKYDPITQEEYFKFRAFFEQLELRHDRVAGEPDPGPFKKYVYAQSYGPISSGLIRVFDEKLDAETFMYSKGDARNRIEGRPPIAPGAPAALGGESLHVQPVDLPPTAWYPGLKPFVQQEERTKRQAAVAAAESALAQAKSASEQRAADGSDAAKQNALQRAVSAADASLSAARADLAGLEARIAADNARYLGDPAQAGDMIRAASIAEREAALAAARAAQAAAEKALADAALLTPADTAAAETQKAQQQLAAAQTAIAAAQAALAQPAADYTPLSPQYPRQSTGRRAALARWIANRANPLTARVAINHVWLRHFGRALVETPFNFGISGKRPTHPELLDWLAVDLMENGWDLKRLHRLLVTSTAYRMRSSAGGQAKANAAIDPDNIWLWRFNPGRMQAEVVRDSVLQASGEMDAAFGGHEIDFAEGLTNRRRSLYFTHHGEAKMEFLELFDAANPCDCYQRTASVQPQQALALANSELTLALSRALAARLWKQVETESPAEQRQADFVQAAFEQVLARPASPDEQRVSTAFLERQASLFASASPAAAATGAATPAADPAARARENLVHALFSHNDFVRIR